MVLPTTGPLSLNDIRDEFRSGHSGAHALNDYYRDGSHVPGTQPAITARQVFTIDDDATVTSGVTGEEEEQALNYVGTRSNAVAVSGSNEFLEIRLRDDFDGGDTTLVGEPSASTTDFWSRIFFRLDDLSLGTTSADDGSIPTGFTYYDIFDMAVRVIWEGVTVYDESRVTGDDVSIVGNDGYTYFVGPTSIATIPFSTDGAGVRYTIRRTFQNQVATFSFDPDTEDEVYSTSIPATSFTDTNATATQALTQIATAAAALETNITWDEVVSDIADVFGDSSNVPGKSITLDLGTETDIEASLLNVANSGSNTTPTLMATHGVPGGPITGSTHTTYTVVDHAGGTVGMSFTGSVATTTSSDLSTVLSQIVTLVNDGTEDPDFSATLETSNNRIFLASSELEAVNGTWGVTVNHHDQTTGIGNIEFTTEVLTEGVAPTSSPEVTITFDDNSTATALLAPVAAAGVPTTPDASTIAANLRASTALSTAATTAGWTIGGTGTEVRFTQNVAAEVTQDFSIEFDPQDSGTRFDNFNAGAIAEPSSDPGDFEFITTPGSYTGWFSPTTLGSDLELGYQIAWLGEILYFDQSEPTNPFIAEDGFAYYRGLVQASDIEFNEYSIRREVPSRLTQTSSQGVPTSSINQSVPTSGTISINDFRGARKVIT